MRTQWIHVALPVVLAGCSGLGAEKAPPAFPPGAKPVEITLGPEPVVIIKVSTQQGARQRLHFAYSVTTTSGVESKCRFFVSGPAEPGQTLADHVFEEVPLDKTAVDELEKQIQNSNPAYIELKAKELWNRLNRTRGFKFDVAFAGWYYVEGKPGTYFLTVEENQETPGPE